VLEGKGVADRSARQAAFSGEPLPAPLDDYLKKVRDDSHQVTDDDFARLRAAGFSEDEIFELTIAAAVGAAERGLQAGLAVLRESGGS
jgi:alkylhydroperoxidase family enzyme